jgi:cytochrome b subunit of formate dehydrogenase
VEETGDTFQPVESYKHSIHGKGVYDSGLYFSAGCVDCHGSHFIFPLADPRSSLHHENVADTCGNANCHVGIHDRFELGIHGKVYLEEKEAYLALGPGEQEGFTFRGPVCTNCHVSHAIKRTSDGTFFKDAILQCGKCHEFAMATYRRSNHGKYALLGSQDVAKCYDCHGNHVNLRVDGPESDFTPEVILERCRECHKKATMEMVSYITHLSLSEGMSREELLGSDALETEKAKGLRVLRVVRMLMEMLLVSVFAFFWLHTILWLVRGTVEKITSRSQVPLEKKTEYFRRLDAAHRILHVFVIVSFLGLAITGLPIKYPHHEWSAVIFGALDSIFQGNGGQVARVMHRIFAIITFGYLGTHLLVLFIRSIHAYHDRIMARCARCPVDMNEPPEARSAAWYVQWIAWALPVAAFYIPLGAVIWIQDRIAGNGQGWRAWLARAFGPESLLPRWKDLKDLMASFRWFFWLGPRPRWDRWTYFEKFDYLAVFWGVALIGLSGLCIWFKEFFTATLGLPGWAINVAMEVHSHEALLATAFIFSIHFFNTHLKPDKFPMDRVIFTGRINRHELEHERPEQYRRLVESGRLDGLRTTRPALWLRVCGTIFGASAVIIGIALVVWIVRMEWNNLFHAF